jgi:hypothetical protein
MVYGKVFRRRIHISTQNFELGDKISQKVIKDISEAVKEGKLQLVNVVKFGSKIKIKQRYIHWRVVSKNNIFRESYFDLGHCIIHKLK